MREATRFLLLGQRYPGHDSRCSRRGQGQTRPSDAIPDSPSRRDPRSRIDEGPFRLRPFDEPQVL